VSFVEFPRLFLASNCLREAGAGGSNPLTPTIKSKGYVQRCLGKSECGTELTLSCSPLSSRVKSVESTVAKMLIRSILFRAQDLVESSDWLKNIS